jgi:hypothetical protein
MHSQQQEQRPQDYYGTLATSCMLAEKGTPATAASQVAVDQEANTVKILRTPAGFSLKISHKNINIY